MKILTWNVYKKIWNHDLIVLLIKLIKMIILNCSSHNQEL